MTYPSFYPVTYPGPSVVSTWSATFTVSAGSTITLTYSSGSPSWKWYGAAF